ncbi:MAG: AraC family transcriptional regulator [Arenimonas sp.]
MTANFQAASFGRSVDLPDTSTSTFTMMPKLVAGLGRGAQISCGTGYLSVWFVGRGNLQITGNHFSPSLFEGQYLVNVETPLKLTSSGDAMWLGIAIPVDMATRMLSECVNSPSALQTGIDVSDLNTRSLVKLLLATIQSESMVNEADYLGLANTLFQLENNARSELRRCPGRTEKSRRLSYQRLARVKNYIALNPCHMEGINELALLANYSDSHFIRTFSRVFSESPLEYAHRLRLAHAKQLIRDGRLSVLEISREVGFATFSAFCRSFRIETGATPSAFRSSVFMQG